jgi:endonuclease G
MDTFAYVNAAPQAALFNQGELSWLGLEDYILGHARTYAQRLSVFTAPILDPNDPPYRGTQIPRRFWKVVAWTTTLQEPEDEPRLAATGYLLDQTPQLDLIDLTANGRAPRTDPPPLGGVPHVPGPDCRPGRPDRLAPVPAAQSTRWRPLQHLGDITV